MTWERALGIALSVALANVIRAYYARYQHWKAARTEIPTARNWRGVYVPDLKLKRLERGILWGWVIFLAASSVMGYFILTNPDLPFILHY